MQELHQRSVSSPTRGPSSSGQSPRTHGAPKRRALSLPYLWPYSWFILILWTFNFLLLEVWIYHHQVAKCAWPAQPHYMDESLLTRIVVIADPQITDINSYPFFQRHPWFGAFVCELSDRFMRKSFRILQWHRKPEHIVIAGDMMDYGRDYALPDYLVALERFRKIFVDDRLVPRLNFYSVAGNHDIGFFTTPKTKQDLVRQFEKHFSALNYEKQIGPITWTFVAATEFSLDTRIKSPFRQQTVDFVQQLQPAPRVLVLHIPLWREQSENCTSLRQTTRQIPYYVRQTFATMLPRDASDLVLSRAKPMLVFSGDDHDVCVVKHDGITEVTVGTFSYMQGVMWPSYVLATQWEECRPSSGCSPRISYSVCWLPSQPYILIWYAVLAVLCLLGLILSVITYAGKSAKPPLSTSRRLVAIGTEALRRLLLLLSAVAIEWIALLLLGY